MIMRRQFGQGFPRLGPEIIEAGGDGGGIDILGQGGSPPPIKRSRLGKALKMAALAAVGGALGAGSAGAAGGVAAGAPVAGFIGPTTAAGGALSSGAALSGAVGAKAAGLKALSESGGIFGPVLGGLLGGEKSKLLDFLRGRK